MEITPKMKAYMAASVIMFITGLVSVTVTVVEDRCKTTNLTTCSIVTCKDYVGVMCKEDGVNLTAKEFQQFTWIACWGAKENVSCSVKRDTYYLHLTIDDCRDVCTMSL